MNELFKIFLSLSFSGTLLILVLFLCKPLYQNKFSKQWQYYIWLVVIVRLLLPISPEISLMGNAFHQFAAVSPPVTGAIGQEDIVVPTMDFNATGWQSGENAVYKEPEKSEGTTAQHVLHDLGQNIWLIWLFGAAVLLIRKITIYQSFVKYIRAGRVEITDLAMWERLGDLLVQAGVQHPVSLYTNGLISSPLLIGFFKPCIMLPTANLSEAEFTYTVLHELIHYKRRDLFYKWLVQLTICLHWFNPFVYWMGREINKACELSCDEVMIGRMDEKDKFAYGNTLIEAMKTGGTYQGTLASVTLHENAILLKERLDAIMNFKKKSKTVKSVTFMLTIAICLNAAIIGAYAVPKETNDNQTDIKQTDGKQVDITESDGVIKIPVDIETIEDGDYVWLGDYTLEAGDKIYYDIPTITGNHITVGFLRPKEYEPTYFTYKNDKLTDSLKVVGEFEVPAILAGEYRLYIRARKGELADIKGMIKIDKTGHSNHDGDEQTILTVPVNLPAIEAEKFIWLGEYDLAHGDKIQYHVSADTGSGMQIGWAAPEDDLLNRTYYTVSQQRYKGSLEVNSNIVFSAPIKPGPYKLFLYAANHDGLTDVQGSITIAKQDNHQLLNFETVTLKNKTYYMITSKEQLLALATGQAGLDKDYMLQNDMDLSNIEWVPIGTEEAPFTGSFNGNGCEIKGLTMTDPNAKVIGLFGYAKGAKIYNVTLRDYDIATAGSNVKGKSIAPILVFGTETDCYDNNVYPKK